ncbi:hypothetical protein A3J20_05380 [Candidatus Gottesmanbacteria bacterium RIFCSPLOWO2_02_FULL_42_29]|nr:MAG: hypothetical protein A2781_03290 [Candidatus Gottesmanbacteria bacterium RIFCSPHIGHO2_01_FULL_42_27]OGG39175.1 MAG: hypothetical protein A3J20_05380 [Candidatus Gottesmanbacteria bacterium RIFCSPLOWO2_02_FULL_42_29]
MIYIDMEKNWQTDINHWLSKLRSQTLRELTKIVFALKESEEELDEYIFKIPYNKFEKEKFKGNIRSWLINLHKKKIIQVWTNLPYKKNKVGSISIGIPITDDKNILFDPTVSIELNPIRFEYLLTLLNNKLQNKTNQGNKVKILRWDGISLDEEGRAEINGIEHKYDLKKPYYLILKSLLIKKISSKKHKKESNDIVTEKELQKITGINDWEKIKQKFRDIRRFHGINHNKEPFKDIFDSQKHGFRLISPRT